MSEHCECDSLLHTRTRNASRLAVRALAVLSSDWSNGAENGRADKNTRKSIFFVFKGHPANDRFDVSHPG